MPTITEPHVIDKSDLVDKIIENDKIAVAYAAERCKTSLKYLCTQMLRYPDWDQCHDEMDKWLEARLEEPCEGKRILWLLLPRGHLKTSFITIGLSIREILKNFNIRILLVNAVWDNARSFLSEISAFLSGKSFLHKLFGNFQTDRFNRDEITIAQRGRANKTPTISTAGIDSAKTSQHYDLIIADDIVNRQMVSTLEQRQKTVLYYKDLLDLLEPKGTLIFVGTRWHDGDLYGEKMREAKANGDDLGKRFYVRKVIENGRYIFPRKFNDIVVDQLKREKGSFEFSSQYLNECLPEETAAFKPPIRYWNDLGDGACHYGAFDPATSEKETACDAVVIDACITRSNQLCAVEYKAFQKKNPDDMIDKIFTYAQLYKWKKLVVETNGGQEVYVKLIQEEQRKRNVFFEIVPIHHTKDKTSRILVLQPRWESGNLLLKQGMTELEDQLLRFPVSEKNDIVDALAMTQEVAEPQYEVKSRAYYPKKFRRAA